MSPLFLEMPKFNEPLCAQTDIEIFFSPSPTSREAVMAKEICGRCVDREACADWALRHEDSGIWGGTSPKERRKMRKQLGIELQAPEVLVIEL
jgi:WhiB family redox-sensing transcriptional regulator